MKILKIDIIMAITAGLSFAEKFITGLVTTATAEKTGLTDKIPQVVDTIEANPLMALVFKAGGASHLVSYILLPAFMVAFYLFARWLYFHKHQDEFHYQMLVFGVNFIFLVFAAVFLNNLGLYLGWLI